MIFEEVCHNAKGCIIKTQKMKIKRKKKRNKNSSRKVSLRGMEGLIIPNTRDACAERYDEYIRQ